MSPEFLELPESNCRNGVIKLIVWLKLKHSFEQLFASFVLGIWWVVDKCEQRNHRITTQIQRRIYGHATDVEIRPLDEEKAVQAAVDLIGELFLFGVTLFAHHSLTFYNVLLLWTSMQLILLF